MPEPSTTDPAPESESTTGEADPDSPDPLTTSAANGFFETSAIGAPASAEAPRDLEVAFHLDTADTDPPAAGWLDEHLQRAARLAGVASGSLSVTLIDDAEMTRLHAEYCDDPTTTDVLTFDLREPGQPASRIEGDLAVCRDEAERQSAARGHDARTELLLYAVHGLLHLLGEDDHAPEDYQRMHQREDELLTALGFGPVFKSGAATSDGQAKELL